MNKKIYEKTRYQNIYRHIKNKNYIIEISKPRKTSISDYNGQKIYDINIAIKLRDETRNGKNIPNASKEKSFEILWDKYIYECKYIKKYAYNTLKKKKNLYNKYFKNKIKGNITKLNKIYWNKFLEEQSATLKQKNEMIKVLSAFYSWIDEENDTSLNPFLKIKKYKVEKAKMKFWIPEEIKQFLEIVEMDLDSQNLFIARRAWITWIMVIICFSTGDRIGETRAISFDVIDEKNLTMEIIHSIEYDPESDSFVGDTKTYSSKRIIEITEKLVDCIKKYRNFLVNILHNEIKESTLLFLNHKTKKPYSDDTLRRYFHYYCDLAHVTEIRLYDLRHTFAATMMLEGLEMYLFSEKMGHKSITTTIKEYGHLSDKAKRIVANVTDKYLLS